MCTRRPTANLSFICFADKCFPCLWAHCTQVFNTPVELDVHLHTIHHTQQVRRVTALNRHLADGRPELRHHRCRFGSCSAGTGTHFATADALSGHLSEFHAGKKHYLCLACAQRFVSYCEMEDWGHEGWHMALMVRSREEHVAWRVEMETRGRWIVWEGGGGEAGGNGAGAGGGGGGGGGGGWVGSL
ncbi:uncharacterized protein H6S33_001080 [Morchella sextelata]|uniref:uncharacterized protein n=1 Tax=Morchella sextelata TaxID=1174677 RepID=UPI001D053322|nr:uncharacterized protein H6S33_001080 [Morchella sextelata]KAH0608852.1 hypothetical protein H6S33_001080 [Morchella sextelata]